jgi:hypothetical protein
VNVKETNDECCDKPDSQLAHPNHSSTEHSNVGADPNRLDAPPKVANGRTAVIMCPILKCIRIIRIDIMKA